MNEFKKTPGSFTLNKNAKKEQPNHPDYKGLGVDLAGNPVWVSAWLKEGQNGKFLSCSMQPRIVVSTPAVTAEGSLAVPEDDVPF